MERRGFLKSLAAGLATPVLAPSGVAGNQVIPWDLFCDPECSRFDLAAPWYAGERLIASDARILVSEIGFGSIGESRHVPNLGHLPWSESDGTGWKSILNLQRTRVAADCELCLGRGRIKATRCRCKKSETVPDSRDYYQERCFECDESGWVGLTCPQCGGSGNSEYCYDLRGCRFNPSYIRRIKAIGDVDCRIIESDDEFLKSIMVFRFGANGYGLLRSLE